MSRFAREGHFNVAISGFFTRHRFYLQAAFDSLGWFIGLTLATWLRYEFSVSKVDLVGVALVAAAASVTQVALGRSMGLYIHRWRFGTFEEVLHCAITVVVVTPVAAVLNRLVLGHRLPVSATVTAGVLALLTMCTGRFLFRLALERSRRPDAEGAERIIVFGAGEGGNQVVRAILNDPASPYVPVALLDDNPDLRNLRLKSIPVLGDRSRLAAVASSLDATTLLIAIPSASGEVIRELSSLADELGLRTLVLPPVGDLFGSAIGVADIRPLTEADLLGRREIATDLDSVADYITGKRVLVTGAGGSIGSELCRHLHRFAPDSLVMLDRDESALQAVQVSIEGRGLLDNEELVVADIRDLDRMYEVFDKFRPDVVFHAAALKHLPLLEMHPAEGFKTNVLGTQNLLDVAGKFGVGHFVNISTDKAADPSSVLGRTKRLAEQLTAHAGLVHDGVYLSVRFGNVLGSRGSVLPLFRTQIDNGGPVTVTHPDVTRYFMTIPEACELVIQAGALGTSGEVMVLDMGEPVRIDDLARRLIAESERPIEIVYTGLRDGEKLHEALFSDDEQSRPSAHPLINTVAVPPLAPADLREEAPLVVDLRDRTTVSDRMLSFGAD